MRRRLLVLSVLLVGLSAVGAPASAGGWWNYVDFDGRSHVAAGDRMLSRTEITFTDVDTAQDARSGKYFVYLVRGIDRRLLNEGMSQADPKRWWAKPDVAISVGRIRLKDRASNLVRATARIRIPQVPPGRYAVMLCDQGCRSPLGDTIPTEGVRVHATASAARGAQAAADLKQLQWDTRSMDEALAAENDALRSSADRAGVVASEAKETARVAEQRVRALEGRVGALESAPPTVEAASLPSVWPWVAVAGWTLAAVMGVVWFSGMRRGRSREAAAAPAEDPTPEREWELASRR